jgi:hypothetical protein
MPAPNHVLKFYTDTRRESTKTPQMRTGDNTVPSSRGSAGKRSGKKKAKLARSLAFPFTTILVVIRFARHAGGELE